MRALQALLIAALALAVTGRKLLDKPCGGVPDGCYSFQKGDAMCIHGDQLPCANGALCNADYTACDGPEEPGPCDGWADGCYHFSHHDGQCIQGQQSLCPNGGRCNAEGTACEPATDVNEWCSGKSAGCYTAHSDLGYYLCKDNRGSMCPQGTHCSNGGVHATCVW